jgi:hypothetical protein
MLIATQENTIRRIVFLLINIAFSIVPVHCSINLFYNDSIAAIAKYRRPDRQVLCLYTDSHSVYGSDLCSICLSMF